MNIYEIKKKRINEPFFFSDDTMRFFGQTLDDFEVDLMADGRYRITADMIDSNGKVRGQTLRYYNPKTRLLERA